MVTSAEPAPGLAGADVWADPATERVLTSATAVTAARTAGAVALAGLAAGASDRDTALLLLVSSLVVYWVGDIADGLVARVRRCETRTGAVLDILCDRLCSAAFYVGLVWLEPGLALPVMVYLANFLVVDCYLSLAFLAWPLRSPNYFHAVDRPLWLWNWSKPGKAVNSAAFAVLLLLTGWAAVGLVVALALLALKVASLVRLGRIGLPVPPRLPPRHGERTDVPVG